MTDFATLVRKTGLLAPEGLASALAERDRTGQRLARILVERGLVDEVTLFEAVAKTSGHPRLDMSTVHVDLAASRKLEPEWALEYRMIPLSVDPQRGTLVVATTDPTQSMLLRALSERFRAPATPVIATESELSRLLRHAYFDESLDRGEKRPARSGGDLASVVPPDRAPTDGRGLRGPPPFPPKNPPAPDADTEPGGAAPRPKGLAYPTLSPRGAPAHAPPLPTAGRSGAVGPGPQAAPGSVGDAPSELASRAPTHIDPELAQAPTAQAGPTSPPASSPERAAFAPAELATMNTADPALSALAPVVEMHQYTAAAIEAIFELCVARGIITREEYLARLGTYDMPKGQP